MKRGGIVLCGGKSSRMGRDKATLPFGPERMLQRVVRLVGEVVDEIVVVRASNQQLPSLPQDVRVVRDEREGRGPLEGLLAGLKGIEDNADAVFATSCDVPLLVPEFVAHLFSLLNDHDIVVPKDDKFHHPLAAVYRVQAALPQVEILLAADRMRPAFLFEDCDTLEIPVEELRVADPGLVSLMNLNRWEDYTSALEIAGVEID